LHLSALQASLQLEDSDLLHKGAVLWVIAFGRHHLVMADLEASGSRQAPAWTKNQLGLECKGYLIHPNILDVSDYHKP
jgi:hypothetical protein